MDANFDPQEIVTPKMEGSTLLYSEIQYKTQEGCSAEVCDMIKRLDLYDQKHQTDFLSQAFLSKGMSNWTLLHLAAERGERILIDTILYYAKKRNITDEVICARTNNGSIPLKIAISGYDNLGRGNNLANPNNITQKNYRRSIALLKSAMNDEFNKTYTRPENYVASQDSQCDQPEGNVDCPDLQIANRWLIVHVNTTCSTLMDLLYDLRQIQTSTDHEDTTKKKLLNNALEKLKHMIYNDDHLPTIVEYAFPSSYSLLQNLTKSGYTALVIEILTQAKNYDERHTTDLLSKALLAQGLEGWTLLHLAIEKGCDELIQHSIDHASRLGILPQVLNATTLHCRTPQRLAINLKRNQSTIDLLTPKS